MYQWYKRHTINILQYLVWIFAEIFSMAVICTFEKFLLKDSRLFIGSGKDSFKKYSTCSFIALFNIMAIFFMER